MNKINYAAIYNHNLDNTLQTDKAREDQVENNAGGFVFQISKWQQLRRFLILGAESGTYYVNKTTHAFNNTKCVEECIKEDYARVLNEIIDVSYNGLAHKQEPTLFALAVVIANLPKNETIPHSTINMIVRTGTHHLTFTNYVNTLCKWNKRVKKIMNAWYNKPVDDLAYQMIKYQNRDKWTQADALRIIHVKPKNYHYSYLYQWCTDRKKVNSDTGIRLLDAYKRLLADKTITPQKVAKMIDEYKLTHEMIPTKFKNDKVVYEALAQNMPLTALIRNLGKLSSMEILTNDSLDLISKIESKLTNVDYLKTARIHPMGILVAAKTYAQGRGFKGQLTWTPVTRVMDALDKAFYLAFKTVEPTNKKLMLAVDVSSSMTFADSYQNIITPIEAAAAMALVTANTEPNYAIYAFSHQFKPLPITPSTRLEDACTIAIRMGFGSTDCALPMLYARKHNIKYDTFIIYTDNETWCGKTHPYQALQQYRSAVNPDAKLIVVAFTSTKFTIADPNDAGMLDIAGLSSDIPIVINQFINNSF